VLKQKQQAIDFQHSERVKELKALEDRVKDRERDVKERERQAEQQSREKRSEMGQRKPYDDRERQTRPVDQQSNVHQWNGSFRSALLAMSFLNDS
jgi:hypothetical protein